MTGLTPESSQLEFQLDFMLIPQVPLFKKALFEL